MNICSAVGCERSVLALGLCPRHYQQWARAEKRAIYRAYWAAYRSRHLDARRASERAGYRANRAGKAASVKRYYVANREAIRLVQRARRLLIANKLRVDKARYRNNHRDEIRHQNAARRALKRGAPGTHTLREWREKVALLGGCCVYCGRADLPLTRDHRIPLTRGGSNNIANILPACGPCNSAKHNQTDSEFLARRMAACR